MHKFFCETIPAREAHYLIMHNTGEVKDTEEEEKQEKGEEDVEDNGIQNVIQQTPEITVDEPPLTARGSCLTTSDNYFIFL